MDGLPHNGTHSEKVESGSSEKGIFIEDHERRVKELGSSNTTIDVVFQCTIFEFKYVYTLTACNALISDVRSCYSVPRG